MPILPPLQLVFLISYREFLWFTSYYKELFEPVESKSGVCVSQPALETLINPE